MTSRIVVLVRGPFRSLQQSFEQRPGPRFGITRGDGITFDVMLNGIAQTAVLRPEAGSADGAGRRIDIEAVMSAWIINNLGKAGAAKARLLQGAAVGSRSPVIHVADEDEKWHRNIGVL